MNQTEKIEKLRGWQPVVLQVEAPPRCEFCTHRAATHHIGLAKPDHVRRISKEVSTCGDCFLRLQMVWQDTWKVIDFADRSSR